MKLAIVSFVAALVVAPLAAQAAAPPARFAATLDATVVDHFTYGWTRVSEDCSIRRTGFGGRELQLRSPRATAIAVTRGSAGLRYRPSAVLARVTWKATSGSFGEVKRCRAEPILKATGHCKARPSLRAACVQDSGPVVPRSPSKSRLCRARWSSVGSIRPTLAGGCSSRPAA